MGNGSGAITGSGAVIRFIYVIFLPLFFELLDAVSVSGVIRFLVFVVIVLGFTPGQSQAQERKHIASPYGERVFHTENIRWFLTQLVSTHPTACRWILHAGSSLYKHGDIYRAVRTQQVSAGEMFIAMLGNKHPVFKLDSLPFLVTDFAEAELLYKASRPLMADILAKDGLRFLYAVPWPPQGIYTHELVTSLADFNGLLLRAYSSTTSQLALTLNATPVSVQAAEIPQAFATGMINAMVTSPSTGVSSQAWDYVDVYTDAQVWIPKNMVFMHEQQFQALSAKQQRRLLLAAEQAEQRGWRLAREETVLKTRQLDQEGMQVVKPGKQLISEFEAVGEQMIHFWKKEAATAPEALDVLSRYLALRAGHRTRQQLAGRVKS